MNNNFRDGHCNRVRRSRSRDNEHSAKYASYNRRRVGGSLEKRPYYDRGNDDKASKKRRSSSRERGGDRNNNNYCDSKRKAERA